MLELVITNKNQKKENELIPEEINDMNTFKLIKDGHVLILRDGHVYTLFGQKIR